MIAIGATPVASAAGPAAAGVAAMTPAVPAASPVTGGPTSPTPLLPAPAITQTPASNGADAAPAAATATDTAAASETTTAAMVTTADPAATAAVATPVPAPRAPTTATLGQPARPLQVGAHAPDSPGLGGAFIALLLVLGLILGLAWLLKRMPGGGFRQADGLRVIASIPLGAKERAAVIQVGDEQLLLGIGPGGVRTLHVLPQPLRTPEPVQMPSLKPLPDFKQMLAQHLRRTPR